MRYGSVPAVRGLSLAVGARRDRRPDRPERRRQVDDAARDHGRRARGGAATSGSRGQSMRGRAPEAIARAGHRARAGGPADLRRAHRRGEPAARARGAPPQRRRRGSARRGLRALPDARRVPRPPGRRALGRPAAAARDRPRARRARRTCCCSTSRRSGSRRPSSTRSSRRSPRSASAASRSCSSSSARSARSRSPTARYVLANGELRMTLTPADADDTEKMIAAYLA